MGVRKGIINDALYEKLVFLALAVMIISIPSSRVLMSMSQMFFGAIWLAHGNYIEKVKAFANNRIALILSSLFVIHVVGVLYSTDIEYALKDLRTKVPILIIPFMFSSFPKINSKKLDILLNLFIGSVLIISLYIALKHFINDEPIREMISREVFSHIRFSLSLNLALFFILLKFWKFKIDFKLKVVLFIVFIWLFYFLFILEAFTGLVVFAVLLPCFLIYISIYTKSKLILIVTIITAVSIPIFSIGYLVDFYQKNTKIEIINMDSLDKITKSGNYYYHGWEMGTENGKYVFAYLQEKELKEEWNKLSSYKYDSLDLRGQHLKFTLIRYLTSLNYRKDKEGVLALTENDIRNIENGIANYHYTQGFGIKARLMKILLEYENYIRTGDPSGHSVMQRIEFWRTAGNIVKHNFWLGVGTGDMNIAFQEEYEKLNSKLDKKSRLRTHNQYLSIWVGLGLLGLLWFVFVLFYPVLYLKAYSYDYFMVFFITLIISMLTEDTIETQAGLSFYVFFYNLFLVEYKPEST